MPLSFPGNQTPLMDLKGIVSWMCILHAFFGISLFIFLTGYQIFERMMSQKCCCQYARSDYN